MFWISNLRIHSAAVVLIPEELEETVVWVLCAQEAHKACLLVLGKGIGPARDTFTVEVKPDLIIL